MCACVCVCTSACFTQRGSPKVHARCGRCRDPLPVKGDDVPCVCATLCLSVIWQWPLGWLPPYLVAVHGACLSLAFHSLGVCPGVELPGHMAVLLPKPGKPAQFSISAAPFAFPPAVLRARFAPRPRQRPFLAFNHCHPSGDVPPAQRGASRDGCQWCLPADRRSHAFLCAHWILCVFFGEMSV